MIQAAKQLALATRAMLLLQYLRIKAIRQFQWLIHRSLAGMITASITIPIPAALTVTTLTAATVTIAMTTGILAMIAAAMAAIMMAMATAITAMTMSSDGVGLCLLRRYLNHNVICAKLQLLYLLWHTLTQYRH